MAESKTPLVEEPLVTREALDLEILEDSDRQLRVPVNYYAMTAEGELGDFVALEWVTYPIRSQLPIPTMTSLLRLETRINEAMSLDDDESADAQLQTALTDSYRRIVSLIVERTPHALRVTETDHNGDTVKVKPQIELDTTQTLAVLAWISGDSTVADAVAKTITAGKSAARTAEEIEDGDGNEDEPGSAEASPPDVPFPLTQS